MLARLVLENTKFVLLGETQPPTFCFETCICSIRSFGFGLADLELCFLEILLLLFFLLSAGPHFVCQPLSIYLYRSLRWSNIRMDAIA